MLIRSVKNHRHQPNQRLQDPNCLSGLGNMPLAIGRAFVPAMDAAAARAVPSGCPEWLAFFQLTPRAA
jgi:hypothetical protein